MRNFALPSAAALVLASRLWLPLKLIYGIGLFGWLAIEAALAPLVLGLSEGCAVTGLRGWAGADD
jgi:hypothetical protein